MATKDWEKITKYKDYTFEHSKVWINQSKNLILFITDLSAYYEFSVVELQGPDWKNKAKIQKTFKTKSQALKYAREYMKSH